MNLWNSLEIAEVTKGEMRGNWGVKGIAIDSREIEKGELFVALKAARDGHEFVGRAIEEGANGRFF